MSYLIPALPSRSTSVFLQEYPLWMTHLHLHSSNSMFQNFSLATFTEVCGLVSVAMLLPASP